MSDYLKIAREVFNLEIESLHKQLNLLDENFAQAVNLILNTKGKVILCGIGKSGLIAKKISATLCSIGLSSVFLHASEASHGDLGMLKNTDTLFILSNSGNSFEFYNILNFCITLNITIISICSNNQSTLYKKSNVCILIEKNCEVIPKLNIPTTSTTLMSVMGDALTAAIVHSKKVSIQDYKTYHPGGSIGISLLTVKDIMKTKNSLPIISLNFEMSDAILEMTKKALGCVIITDAELKILGIITDGDLRRHLFKDLIHLPIEQVMNKKPKCISQNMFLTEALQYMYDNSITILIVSENQKLIGLLHIHDCLRYSSIGN